jgi:hypothetical protein
MANPALNYGDSFQILSLAEPNPGPIGYLDYNGDAGYLTVDSNGKAVTTSNSSDPNTIWIAHPDPAGSGTMGKPINAQDTVLLINAASLNYLQADPGNNKTPASYLTYTVSTTTVSDSKNTPLQLKWEISNNKNGQPIYEKDPIWLRNQIIGTTVSSANMTGAFLCVEIYNDKATGPHEIYNVYTQNPFDVKHGPTTWWQIVNIGAHAPAKNPKPVGAQPAGPQPAAPQPASGHPTGQPGGGNNGNALCNQLPSILKSICSMVSVLNKVVDACYPPSSWPTSSYPDGCGNVGDCGCGGKGSGTGGPPKPIRGNHGPTQVGPI